MNEKNRMPVQEERILQYKLEQHLNEVCNNSTYANLLSVWNINKKMCQDILSTVVMNYPHYTKHDKSHCEAIITNIEMLLGEENIRILSPTDTWLLLHAAYLHDIGMAIECNEIEKNWESQEFQDYLKELENSADDSLAQSAVFINSLGDKLLNKENIMAWPVRVKYTVTLLIAEYYRKKHAKDSESYIKKMGSTFHIDLGFNGLIQQRLIRLLADIAYLHTEPNYKILDLDYQTNGFNADYAHPRFLAQMLRMGDLLDADNNRFNTVNETVFGTIPESSRNHWKKHMSARHILITPDVIEYRADCSNLEVYRETKNFVSWLKEEVEFWTLNWKSIMPETIKGSAPRLGKCELLLDGVPDIQGLSDLRFSISPEKAFEVIEGSNIYEDKFVFLREVIQNALDACKIRLWRDISEERYKSWISHEGDGEIQPFEIEDAIFNNYGVQVKICNYDDKNFKIIIKDNGIGISVEQFKKICNVGVSYSGDEKRRNEINNMPLWLRPTAGFGIGLQSIFLVAEEFEIYSRSSTEEEIYARVASRRKNGYVQVTKSNKLKAQGTEIHIILPRDMNFKYGFSGNTYQYIEEQYDPFSGKNDLLYYKLWDVLRENMDGTYFPVEIFFEDMLMDKIKPHKFKELQGSSSNERYLYRKLDGYEMELWDTRTYTRMHIKLRERYSMYNNRYFFKGMEINGNIFRNMEGVRYDIDFYGLDTKKTLTLDRKRIREEALDEIFEIVNSAIEFFQDEIEKTLFEDVQDRGATEYNQIYTYWCMATLKKKQDLINKYGSIFEKVKVPVKVLKKQQDGQFAKKEYDFKEIISDLQQIAIVQNLESYVELHANIEKLNIELVCSILKGKNIPFSTIVIDRDFTKVMKSLLYSKVMTVLEEDNVLYLKSLSVEERKIPDTADIETKKILLSNLLAKSRLSVRYGFHGDSERRYTIGLKEYEKLCTTVVPFGIGGDWYYSNAYIISPITISQWESNRHLEENAFTEAICATDEFTNLVEHVFLNQFEKEKYSRKEIANEYKRFIKDMYKFNVETESEKQTGKISDSESEE